MVARVTQGSSFNRRCTIGAPTPFWELHSNFYHRILCLGWAQRSRQADTMGAQPRSRKIGNRRVTRFCCRNCRYFFYIAIAIFVVVRYRRVAAIGGLYPRLVALLGSFLFLLLVPFLPKNELSPTLDLLSILLMLSESILATVALLYLGRSFSILPEARRLVVTGPYRLVLIHYMQPR